MTASNDHKSGLITYFYKVLMKSIVIFNPILFYNDPMINMLIFLLFLKLRTIF